MKKTKLNITFHNPNTTAILMKELIKISAEVAKLQVDNTLLHIESAEALARQA